MAFATLQLPLGRPVAPHRLGFPLGSQPTSSPAVPPPSLFLSILAFPDLGSAGQSLQTARRSLPGIFRARISRCPPILGERVHQEAVAQSPVGFNDIRVRLVFSHPGVAGSLRILRTLGGPITGAPSREFRPRDGHVRKEDNPLYVPFFQLRDIWGFRDCVFPGLLAVLLESAGLGDQ